MLKTIALRRMPLVITLLLAAGLAAAQETPKSTPPPDEAQAKPFSVYRLDYVVRELEDGKRINTRAYSLSVRSDAEWGRIRIGNKVPIDKTARLITPPGTLASSNTIEYENVGINIDSKLRERDNSVVLYTRFDSSSVVTPDKPTEGPGSQVSLPPVFRQVRFEGESLVTLGKPTVIGVLDDVVTNRHHEIEVTVTKMK